MTKLLTPQEALQALIDGKKIEVYSEIHNVWWEFDPQHFCVDTLLNKEVKFRMPQEMITISDVSFPKPYRGKIEKDQVYYFPSIDISALYSSMHWTGSGRDRRIMKKGLLHLSKENAIAHAKALIRLSGGKI